MNKKILAFFCAVTVACSLSACGNNNKNSSSTASDTQSTTSEPQPSSSTAESNVSSDKIKDGTETLADGSKLTIKGDTITVQKDDDVGTITSIYEFENDTLESSQIIYSNIKSKDAVMKKIEEENLGDLGVMTENGDASITLKAKDETVQKMRNKFPSKADLVRHIRSGLKMRKNENQSKEK